MILGKMPHTEEGKDLYRREVDVLRAERIGEQRKAEYAKVIEHIGRYYEAQDTPFGGPARARGETEQIEANRMEVQKEANGRLGELFEDLGLAWPNEGVEEDERRELYAVAASIFA